MTGRPRGFSGERYRSDAVLFDAASQCISSSCICLCLPERGDQNEGSSAAVCRVRIGHHSPVLRVVHEAAPRRYGVT